LRIFCSQFYVLIFCCAEFWKPINVFTATKTSKFYTANIILIVLRSHFASPWCLSQPTHSSFPPITVSFYLKINQNNSIMKSPSACILMAALASTCSAFTIPAAAPRTTTHLNLRPDQGCQLAAAWEAASFHLDDAVVVPAEEDHPHVTPTAAARAFVSRVFSLPSTLLHPQEEEEVVYYPVIGFQFCSESNKPLPTSPFPTAACCRIPSTKEQLTGWFSPACHLESFNSESYCAEPPTTNL
jgi:hypothetical protein